MYYVHSCVNPLASSRAGEVTAYQYMFCGRLQNEEENFALYNYVNELSSETDELQAEINSLRESILKMHTKEGQRSKGWETQMNSIEASINSSKLRESIVIPVMLDCRDFNIYGVYVNPLFCDNCRLSNHIHTTIAHTT